LGIFVQVFGNPTCHLVDIECFPEIIPLATCSTGVFCEGRQCSVDNVQLGIESACVDDSLARGAVFALEEYLPRLAVPSLFIVRCCYRNGISQEVSDIGSESQEGLISSILRLLHLFQSLCGLGFESRKKCVRFLQILAVSA